MPSVDARAVLRAAQMRVTEPRIAVLEALDARPHGSADEIYAAVASALPTTSKQAVYNVLHDLVDHGLARRIEPGDHPARYELRVDDNHHHVVCRGCGTIADVDCVVGHAPCLVPSQSHGFAVVEAEVTFWGLCEACSGTAAPSPASSPVTSNVRFP